MGYFSDIANAIREAAAAQSANEAPGVGLRERAPESRPTEKYIEPVEPRTVIEAQPQSVSYTYKKGDNFAKVLVDLGLSDGKNLWGDDGDVQFYNEQLRQQGIDADTNIPIGTTFSLIPRNVVEEYSNGIEVEPRETFDVKSYGLSPQEPIAPVRRPTEARTWLDGNGVWRSVGSESNTWMDGNGRWHIGTQQPSRQPRVGMFMDDTRPRSRTYEDNIIDYLQQTNPNYNLYDLIQNLVDTVYYRASERGLITPEEYANSGAVVDQIVSGQMQPRILRRRR